jgi:ABC-2 type transport system permease protein
MRLLRELRAAYAFIERNSNLVKRYWGWELVWLTYSIVEALAITYLGAGIGAITGQSLDTAYLILYLLVGTLVWAYLATIFDGLSEAISWERWEGTIEYTFMAPASRLSHFLGTTAFAIAYGLVRTLLILGVVALSFHLDLGRANLPGAVLVLLGGSLAFIGLGILAAILPLLFPERGEQMSYAFQALILLVSGIYYPVEVLPPWLQRLAAISPATYALQGIRAALLEGEPTAALAGELLPLVLMGLILIPSGLMAFSLAERYAKRTGRLKRSG